MFRNLLKKSLPILAGSLIIALVVSILPSGYFAEASKNTNTNLVEQKYITLEEAEQIALKKVNDKSAEIIDFEVELTRKEQKYDFEIITSDKKYEIEINAVTGDIIEYQVKSLDKEKVKEYKEKKNIYKEYKKKLENGTIISKYDAKMIALKQVNTKSSHVTRLEIVLETKTPHYLIVVRDKAHKYTMKVEAETGKVYDLVKVAKVSDEWDNSEKDKPVVELKYITKDKAIEIALAKIGSKATLDEIEFDKDDNPPKYEIEMYDDKYEYEIEIHAITGAILEFEKELD